MVSFSDSKTGSAELSESAKQIIETSNYDINLIVIIVVIIILIIIFISGKKKYQKKSKVNSDKKENEKASVDQAKSEFNIYSDWDLKKAINNFHTLQNSLIL